MEEAARLFQPLGAQRLGDHVYRHLIEAIATGRLPQGAKIQEDVLAAQMGVSKTPIREALRRLETRGDHHWVVAWLSRARCTTSDC